MNEIRENVLYSKIPDSQNEVPNKLFIHHLLDLIESEFEGTGDREWLVDCVNQTSVKISEIKRVSCKVARGLKKLGFGPGDTLHTAYSSCIDFYWPVFGAWLCGGVVSVADPALSTELLRSQIVDTKAKIVVCTLDAASRFISANGKLPKDNQIQHILVIDREPGQEFPAGCSSFRELLNDDGASHPLIFDLHFDPQQPALIHWSSGTTGAPKGIIHSQRTLHRNLAQGTEPPGTISLSSSVMFHAGAFMFPLNKGISSQFKICFITEDYFNGKNLLNIIDKYKPWFYYCGTDQFATLSKEEQNPNIDLSSLMIVCPAGATISATAVENIHKLLPNLAKIVQVYGCTETYHIAYSVDHNLTGALLPGASMYIRDRETGDKKLGPNESGEIMIQTKRMLLRYLNREEETKKYFDEDGFVHMGDIGHYDQEGNIYYESRMKELLKVRNYWFGPGELEDLLEQIPYIDEAVVWGTHDPTTGDDIVNAAIVLSSKSDMDNSEIQTKKYIVAYVNTRLQPQKHLTGKVIFLDKIPHNPSGKKLRMRIKNNYSNKEKIIYS